MSIEVSHAEVNGEREGSGALSGLRVLDLSNYRTGAQASQTLADFGAEVIHVEPPGGSPLRRQAAWRIWGRGKRSAQLDLRDPAQVETCRRLIRTADVVIETFRPDVAERLGLAYEVLAAENPGLIWASVTGFGRTGPLRELQGYEGVVSAKLGVYWTHADLTDRSGPSFSAAADAAFPASQLALSGILAALHARERTGLGQRVDTTLAQGLTVHDTSRWFARVVLDSATASSSDGKAPTGTTGFGLLTAQTRDNYWLQFAQVGGKRLRAMLRMFGLEAMYEDPHWRGLPDFEGGERRDAFWERLLSAVRSNSLAEWSSAFAGDRTVWAERYRRGAELLDHPQMQWNRMVVETEDPDVGRLKAPGPIAQLSATPGKASNPAPALGKDDIDWDAPRRAPAGAGSAADMQPALAGVTVVELSSFYPAPYAASILAELGARVIKLEPLDGDPLRSQPPYGEVWALKTLLGKESVAIDLNGSDGREIARSIIAGADIVLHSYRAGAMDRLGLDKATLKALNPNIIVQCCAGYGEDGPCGDRPAFGTSIGAATGYAWRNVGASLAAGETVSLQDVKRVAHRLNSAATAVGNADGPATVINAASMLLALVARDRGAEGQSALTTMLLSGAHSLAEQMADFEGAPPVPESDTQLYGFGPLYRLYEASEGWVFLAAPGDHEWRKLVAALPGSDRLTGDPRFSSAEARRANGQALADALSAIFRTRPAQNWEFDLRAADVACVEAANAPVESHFLDPGDVGASSGFLARTFHPHFGELPRLAPLIGLSRSAAVLGDAPVVGQHTEKVLRELGYQGSAIAELEEKGAIRRA
jgi:crotonobetainyl-CoA:carnitine CoA-transferase CaiB-like acyl-CoA transferase